MKPSDDDTTAHPERIGRYALLLPIASGGMGTVYLSRTRGIGGFERDVALKLSHPSLNTPEFTLSLLDEAVLAGGIRHPNVVSVLDVGEDPHGLYVVMEYVEGDSLAGLVRRARQLGKTIPPSIFLRLMDDALTGLHAAHELVDANGENVGLVHRDFSPQNILVGVDGLAKLTDFGVAKALGRLSVTTSGAIKGKVAYMAPEQARGEPLDRRVDVWAAGVVIWELLAGARLYRGVPDAVMLLKIVSERPPRLRFVRSEIPAELDEVVAQALEPDLAKRFQDADSFARALALAAKRSIGLADRRDAAELVKSVVEPQLVARREKVKRIVELREQMGHLTRLPSRPGVTPSNVALVSPAEEAPREGTHTDGIGVASTKDARPVPSKRPRGRSVLLWLAAACAVLVTGAVVLIQSQAEPARRLEHASWRPISVPRATPVPSEMASAFQLRVSANAAVQELSVDDVKHTIEPPRKSFSLSIRRAQHQALNLVALSVDGAETKLVLSPDSSLALLRFPAISKGEPRPGLLPSPYPR